jgi:hypothetical protein
VLNQRFAPRQVDQHSKERWPVQAGYTTKRRVNCRAFFEHDEPWERGNGRIHNLQRQLRSTVTVRSGLNSVVEDCDGLIQEDQAHNAMSALIALVAKLS